MEICTSAGSADLLVRGRLTHGEVPYFACSNSDDYVIQHYRHAGKWTYRSPKGQSWCSAAAAAGLSPRRGAEAGPGFSDAEMLAREGLRCCRYFLGNWASYVRVY